MKKLLAIILAAVMLLSVTACGGSGETEPSKGSSEPCGKHTGKGVCSVCGVDYFDELVKHLQENYSGEYKEYRYDNGSSTWYIKYKSSTNCIECFEDKRDVYLYIYKSDLNECKYEWKSKTNPFVTQEYSGLLDASIISPYTYKNYINLSQHSYNNMAVPKDYGIGMTTIINDALIPLIKEIGKNITPSDFGFTRFG